MVWCSSLTFCSQRFKDRGLKNSKQKCAQIFFRVISSANLSPIGRASHFRLTPTARRQKSLPASCLTYASQSRTSSQVSRILEVQLEERVVLLTRFYEKRKRFLWMPDGYQAKRVKFVDSHRTLSSSLSSTYEVHLFLYVSMNKTNVSMYYYTDQTISEFVYL